MAVTTAETVTVEIIAKLDKATGDIRRLDQTFTASTNSMQGAAKSLESSLDRVARTSTDSFNRVGTGSRKAADSFDRDAARIANAGRNIGRQISDAGTQLAGGQSPLLIFAQQAPQVADALADTGGRAAKVASFFAGPWGAAILAAGSIIGTVLVPKLFEASSAAETMTGAQIELSRFVDLTTGAINRQTQAVQRLAAAQARQEAVETGTQTYKAARGGALSAVREAAGERAPAFAAGVRLPDATTTDPIKKRLRELADEAVRTRRPINDLVLDVRKLVGNRPEYAGLVKSITAQGGAAVEAAQGVERLKAEQALLTGTATAAQRAMLGMGLATTGLVERQVALATATTGVEKARARLSLVEERGRAITAGDGAALVQYRTDLTAATNAVKSAEAAERAATGARRDGAKAARTAAAAARAAAREQARDTRIAARAERELLSLQGERLAARSDLTSDRAQQDDFARQRINLEAAGRVSELAERRDRGELDASEFAARKALIEEITNAKLAYVDRTRDLRAAADEVEVARARSDAAREVLEAESGLARTAADRKAIELQLLDLAIEERRLAAQRVVDLAKQDKASEQERILAQTTLDALPRIREIGAKRIDREYQSPLALYRDRLNRTPGETREQAEQLVVDEIEHVRDGIADALSDAIGTRDPLINGLLKLLIDNVLLKPIAAALDQASAAGGGGGVGGVLGAIAGSIGGLLGGGGSTPGYGGTVGGRVIPGITPGFANGGSMTLGGRGGVDTNMLSLNGQPLARVSRGETMSIVPSSAAMRPAGAMTKVFNISVSANNSVTPAGFAQGLANDILARAAEMDGAVVKGARRGLPEAQARYNALGTTG
ncbi:MAG TPA: phage tail length tape measure family protein [Sphingomonas sp.]|jgi:hypothetical protein|uniref:phage tail length tape measure family protein n=1 Tax=Sphingomonas sp. TaxID=28214 RepID=UPI002EDADEF6